MVPPERVRRAAVLLYRGSMVAEVIELAGRLASSEVEVVFTAVSAAELRDHSGLRLLPDQPVDVLDPTSIDLVVVPGGDPASIVDDDVVMSFLAAVTASGGHVAGICAGVLVMAAAGLFDGRRITHNYRSPWSPPEVEQFVEHIWSGAIVEDDRTRGVVVDGSIITALPNAAIEFATTVCAAVGVYTPEHASLIARHLRGEYVEELFTPPRHS